MKGVAGQGTRATPGIRPEVYPIRDFQVPRRAAFPRDFNHGEREKRGAVLN
jgi:hypothetical protein